MGRYSNLSYATRLLIADVVLVAFAAAAGRPRVATVEFLAQRLQLGVRALCRAC